MCRRGSIGRNLGLKRGTKKGRSSRDIVHLVLSQKWYRTFLRSVRSETDGETGIEGDGNGQRDRKEFTWFEQSRSP